MKRKTSTDEFESQSISQLLPIDGNLGSALRKSLLFDWFCPDNQLVRRVGKLMPKLCELSWSPLFDNARNRVFFKNLHEPELFGEDQIHILSLDEKATLPCFIVSPPRRILLPESEADMELLSDRFIIHAIY